jgi:hypothetical protein
MEIEKITDYQYEKIEDFLEKNQLTKLNLCLSFKDIENAVELYEKILNSSNNTIVQFGSSAGGFTSYHYFKNNDQIFIIEAFTQEIQGISPVYQDWLDINKSTYHTYIKN